MQLLGTEIEEHMILKRLRCNVQSVTSVISVGFQSELLLLLSLEGHLVIKQTLIHLISFIDIEIFMQGVLQ